MKSKTFIGTSKLVNVSRQFPNSFTKMRSYCQQNCEKKQEIAVSYLLILIHSCFQGYIFKNVLCLNYYMQIIYLSHCLLYIIIVIVKGILRVTFFALSPHEMKNRAETLSMLVRFIGKPHGSI